MRLNPFPELMSENRLPSGPIMAGARSEDKSNTSGAEAGAALGKGRIGPSEEEALREGNP